MARATGDVTWDLPDSEDETTEWEEAGPTPVEPALTNGALPTEEALAADRAEVRAGFEALARLPAWQRLELLADLSAAKVSAEDEMAAFLDRILQLRHGSRPELAGLPLPQQASTLLEPADVDTWKVQDLFRPGTTNMIAAEPGSAKTWASRQLAMAAAVGAPHFLHERYEIAAPMQVLVVDEDNGEREEWLREERIRADLGVERKDLWRLHRVHLTGAKLEEERWQLWLDALIAELRIELLILDPISEMHGGKELREDVNFASLRRFLKHLRTAHPDMATVLVHHARKRPPGDRAAVRALEDVRGQWGQTPDVVAILSPLGERRFRWEVHKRAPFSSLILEQTDPGPLTCVAVEGQRKVTTDNRVLGAIEAGAVSVDEVVLATELSARAIWNAVKRLRKVGLLTANGPLEITSEEA